MQLQKERRAKWWRYRERAVTVEEKKESAQMERKNEKVTEEK